MGEVGRDAVGDRFDMLESRMDVMEEAHHRREQFLYGWADESGWHKGIVHTLSDGVDAANRELSIIRQEINGFLVGLKKLAFALAGILIPACGSAAWWLINHLPQVARLFQSP